jgi:hypothetical protein
VMSSVAQEPGSLPRASADVAPSSSGRVRVAYIGGSGRSGSTLLERMLGQVDGFCAVGELVHLWERGVAGNELCGCGARFHDCKFWLRVGAEAFGGWEAVDSAEMLSLHRSVNRHRFIPFMVTPSVSRSYERRANVYGELQERLYRAIQRVTGCRIVVDSSKEVPYPFLLARVEGLRLSLVHLVRDSRGVAHSWQKRVVRPEVAGGSTYMPRYHPARAAADWTIDNVLFEFLGSHSRPRHFVRYEDLAEYPQRSIRSILRFLGWPGADGDLGFVARDHVELGPTHSVAGNPMRFRLGRVPVRLDETWRERMSSSDRLLVSAMTWPLLSRYGYPRTGT